MEFALSQVLLTHKSNGEVMRHTNAAQRGDRIDATFGSAMKMADINALIKEETLAGWSD
jgi:hypothetical protein